jgi:SAM-dependent methyltransferase
LPSPLVTPRARVRLFDGRLQDLNVERWMADPDEVDHRILDRTRGPVLDVGCGPGRHVEALALRGTEVLGLDLSADFVAMAQRDQRPVLLQSVFDPVPGGSRWRCALILDGSIGIGGDPGMLLRRVGHLLTSGGRVLVETGTPDEPTETLSLCIESETGEGNVFDWATLSASDAAPVAARSGFDLTDLWEDAGRWFVQLEKRRWWSAPHEAVRRP